MILQTKDILGSYFWLRSSLLLFIADEDGLVLEMNPFAREFLHEEEAGGAFLDRIVHFGEPLDWAHIMKDADQRHLWSIARKNDTPVSFYFGFSPMDQGYLIVGEQNLSEFLHAQNRFLELSREMSQITRTLQKSHAELAARNEQIRLFLGMAAHDLRSPIGVILNFGEYLQDALSGELDSQERTFLDRIVQYAEYVLRMLDDLLDVVSLEQGRVRLTLEETDLADLIERAIAMQSVFSRKKGISILFDRPGEGARIQADPLKLEQVFNNLISNAVKYSMPDQEIRVRLQRAGSGFQVEVADRGMGIPEDKLSRIFEPFGTASTGGTAGEKSTGLGLVIVRHIVEAHGGEVSVQSRAGEGSTFVVFLPV